MAHPILPRFVVLKSQRNEQYLCHVNDNGEFHGYLQFSGTDFKSSHVKFEIEASSTVDGLVHLKCCYNNKYWVCHQNDRWIRVDANEKEEDQSKWSCTLFKPVFFAPGRIGLYHVYKKTNVFFGDIRPHNLYVGVVSDMGDYLDYVDWESLPILPRYIAIKGDNGCYLGATKADPQSAIIDFLEKAYGFTLLGVFGSLWQLFIKKKPVDLLRFDCEEKGNENVGHEVFTNPDGTIRIKNIHLDRFWRQEHNWIRPDSTDSTNEDHNTLFNVVMVDNKKIALKNLGNQRYCMRFTQDIGKDNFLNVDSTNIIEKSQFQVEELVTKRQIYHVVFHTRDARINKRVTLNETALTSFNNTEVTQKSTVKFSYTKEESETWNTSISTKHGTEIGMEITAPVPEIGEVGVNVKETNEVTTTYEHGKESSVSEKIEIEEPVDVPSKSKVKGHLLVTKVSVDIPYSYTQRDTLVNGITDISHRDDGVYTKIHTEIEVTYNPVSG